MISTTLKEQASRTSFVVGMAPNKVISNHDLKHDDSSRGSRNFRLYFYPYQDVVFFTLVLLRPPLTASQNISKTGKSYASVNYYVFLRFSEFYFAIISCFLFFLTSVQTRL